MKMSIVMRDDACMNSRAMRFYRDTFDYFIEKTALNVEIEALLAKVDHKTISSVEEASESIQ
jgi:hypothetical protein